jgi:hypothetical protein
MPKDYFTNYYQKNKSKIKEQSKTNYNKKKLKTKTIPVEFKQGNFIIYFN